MRSIINISMPKSMAKTIEKETKRGGFASKSEFLRHVIRSWNTYKLAQELKESRKEFKQGKAKLLRSFEDLR